MARARPRPSKRRVEKFDFKTPYNSRADPIPQEKRTRLKDLGDTRIYDANDNGAIDPDLPNEYMEERVAFCCYQCICTEANKEKLMDDLFIQSSIEGLFHRRCCHELYDEPDENWKSPFEKATDASYLNQVIEHNVMTDNELKVQYDIAKQHENAIYSADENVEYVNELLTNVPYIENQKRFQQIPKSEDGMVVLDMFAGIGSGIVALKRLGIAMKKIIHVEHDPVANHVYKWNHDPMYNDTGSISDDIIEHVYVEKFEDFEENLEDYLSKHGPIDFVIGGPPCVDYSGLNAHREGIHGQQGGYMLRFGALIQAIKRIQSSSHHVFFLAENTILRNDGESKLEDGDLESIKRSFGVQWSMDVNAAYFTPGRRNRTYISNIPWYTKEHDYVLDEELRDCSYLTDDFIHCAHFVCDHRNEERMILKVPCLLACRSRIDAHPQMSVVKESIGNDGEPYAEHRPLNIKERERVMGFPSEYVEEAVNELFQNLEEKGYGNTRLPEYETYWKTGLPEKYHVFGGLPKKVKFDSSNFPVKAKLQPPIVNTVNVFYDQEQYAKRLIGNAFSVPVVEILLRELQKKFPTKRYDDYTYCYVWRTPQVGVKEEGV